MPKVNEVKKDKICILCKTSHSDELDFGVLRKIRNFSAHHFCLLLSETIQQSGTDNQGFMGFMHGDVIKEMRLSKLKQCCYCKKFEATLGCSFKGCLRKFHLSCAVENNAKRNFESFTSLCHVHASQTNVPEDLCNNIEKHNCLICFEDFSKNIDLRTILWAECCKGNLIFHLKCLKQMASSAGYFTKCPGCNNKDLFVRLLKTNGIFVPERDASWEESRNAFSDLRYVHKMCDVSDCKCPKGRSYSHAGKWKLSVCNLCGSYGTHFECSPHEEEYICPVCSASSRESNNEEALAANLEQNDSIICTTAPLSVDHLINNNEFPHCSKSVSIGTDWEPRSLKRKLSDFKEDDVDVCDDAVKKLTPNEIELRDNINAEFEFVNFSHQNLQSKPFLCNLRIEDVRKLTEEETKSYFCDTREYTQGGNLAQTHSESGYFTQTCQNLPPIGREIGGNTNRMQF